MAASFQIDAREFNRTLRAYAARSKKEPGKIVVQKGFLIARGAARLTPRVDPELIKRELGASEVHALNITKRGKFSRDKKRNRTYSFGGSMQVESDGNGKFTQRIFKILAARLRNQGKAIPHDFYKYGLRVLSARTRSTAFLAAGWLEPIKKLGELGNSMGIRGVRPMVKDKALKTFKNTKKLGRATIHSLGEKASLTIENAANAKHDHKQALIKYGAPALHQAFADESASTERYIWDRYRSTARESGVKFR